MTDLINATPLGALQAAKPKPTPYTARHAAKVGAGLVRITPSSITGLQADAPRPVFIRNLTKATIAQLLTTEKKSPDYAWFKPERKPIPSDTDWCAVGGAGRLMEAYYRYPMPEPLLLTAGVQPVALLPERCIGKPSFDRAKAAQPLKAASEKKSTQEADPMIVKIAASADCLPAEPLVTQVSAGPIVWAGRSPTPGLPEVISTKRCAEILAEARILHPEWLIDGSRVRKSQPIS